MENNDIVIIELDRPRELKLTNRVLKRFLAKTGIRMKNFDEAVDVYENMVLLIFYMLQADDPTLTEDKVDLLLDKIPITEIITKCAAAIAAGFGETEKQKEQDPGKENPTEP